MRTGAALLAGTSNNNAPASAFSADPAQDSTPGCTHEPRFHTNMSARSLNLSQGEGSPRAIIEVRIWSEKAVSSGCVTAAATTSSGRAAGLDRPVRMISLIRALRTQRHWLPEACISTYTRRPGLGV